MKNFFALLKARNKEFYRDKAALSWSFVLPLFIIVSFVFAFSEDNQKIFTVGVFSPTTSSVSPEMRPKLPPAFNKDYIDVISFSDIDKALNRIKYHQIDLLIQPSSNNHTQSKYWINKSSANGEVLEQLMLHDPQLKNRHQDEVFQRETVEGRQVRYIDWAMPGILGMNLMFSSLFGVGYVIVRYRKNGVLKRLQATPVTAIQFLSAQVTSRLLLIVTVIFVIYSGSDYFLDFLMLGSYGLLLLIAILGGFALISFGLVIASRTESEELAGGLLNFVTFPMLILSEVWFSLESAPEWLQWVSQCLPLTHLVTAAREVMINGASAADVSHHLIMLSLMCVVFLSLAAALFRWHKE